MDCFPQGKCCHPDCAENWTKYSILNCQVLRQEIATYATPLCLSLRTIEKDAEEVLGGGRERSFQPAVLQPANEHSGAKECSW